jgi:hypothetical protein
VPPPRQPDLRPHFDYATPPPRNQVQFPTATPAPQPTAPSTGGLIVPDGRGGFAGGGVHTTKDGNIIYGAGSIDGRGNGSVGGGIIVNPPKPTK